MHLYIRLLSSVLLIFTLSNFLIASDKVENKSFSNFELNDYNGKKYTLNDFKDSNAIVIMFIATQCPISNDYNERMAKVYTDYKGKGITFLGINSNKQEDVEEIREHAEENGLDFIILKDNNNVIADVFEASFTPEIFILNSNFELLYHGRIDDSRKGNNIKSQDLRNALDEILSGKEVTVSKTKAFGCTIKRVKK